MCLYWLVSCWLEYNRVDCAHKAGRYRTLHCVRTPVKITKRRGEVIKPLVNYLTRRPLKLVFAGSSSLANERRRTVCLLA
jgi:hypothetical protein